MDFFLFTSIILGRRLPLFIFLTLIKSFFLIGVLNSPLHMSYTLLF
jgi:hypothetical protein